jgi:CxxC-x17-CxxC domain-containing protein
MKPFREMFDVVCSDCGKDCQVPFKPTNSKPVLCSRCFEKKQGGSSNNRNFSRPSFRSNNRSNSSFRNNNNRNKEMFDVVCTNCGKDCQVPFKPTNSKPVLCSQCFENEKNSKNNPNQELLEKIDKKLDVILEKLENKKPKKRIDIKKEDK